MPLQSEVKNNHVIAFFNSYLAGNGGVKMGSQRELMHGGDGLVLHVLHHGHSLEILSVRNHFYVRLRKA